MHNFIVRSSIASGGGEWGKSTETKDIDKWMLTQQSSFLSQEDAGCFTRVTKKKNNLHIKWIMVKKNFYVQGSESSAFFLNIFIWKKIILRKTAYNIYIQNTMF